MAGEGQSSRFTVLSSERLRHHFMVQTLFVPSLNGVLLELLGAAGQHLARVVPASARAGRDFDPAELALEVLDRHRAVLLGYERANGSVMLDPRQMTPNARVAWSDVRSLYVVADGRRVAAGLA
jgi:hypothetical protein